LLNALTIDLEPWMCFYGNVPLEKRLVEKSLVDSTYQILNIFDDYKVTVTFFVLGIIYKQFPSLVDEIKSRGHEIAFHGYSHKKLSENSLKLEIEKSRDLIEKYHVIGFRAPEMRVTWDDLNTLDSADFLYDSSTYGSFNSTVGGIVEVPVSIYPARRKNQDFPRTLKGTLKKFEIPIGSGLFVSLLSSRLFDNFIRKINREGLPAVLFIHPWQISGLPEIRMGQLIRHPSKILYLRRISEKKLRFILGRHEFAPIREILEDKNLIKKSKG
jgi:peptidoglycan/xylan/chitin deacetylase (PgdA/CDA1 family)